MSVSSSIISNILFNNSSVISLSSSETSHWVLRTTSQTSSVEYSKSDSCLFQTDTVQISDDSRSRSTNGENVS